MSNYLIKRGQKWSVKVATPADVQHIFGKRAFKKSLKTSEKAVAISRSGSFIAQFKVAIEEARGNPTQHLDEYLVHTQSALKEARAIPDTGLEAQKRDISIFLETFSEVPFGVIREFTDVLSGTDDSRPELLKAIDLAKRTGADRCQFDHRQEIERWSRNFGPVAKL